MSEQNSYEILGVATEASFDEIQSARSRLSQEYSSDRKQVEKIEAAYDAIIMDRLKLRQEGKIKVPEGIRFPEQKKPKPAPVVESSPSPSWLQDYLDSPSQWDIVIPAMVFGVGAALTLLAQSPNDPVLALVFTFGLVGNVYFITRKEKRFGRALLISLLAIVVGTTIGSLLANLSGVPLGNGGLSAAQVVNVVTLVIFWLVSSFLR